MQGDSRVVLAEVDGDSLDIDVRIPADAVKGPATIESSVGGRAPLEIIATVTRRLARTGSASERWAETIVGTALARDRARSARLVTTGAAAPGSVSARRGATEMRARDGRVPVQSADDGSGLRWAHPGEAGVTQHRKRRGREAGVVVDKPSPALPGSIEGRRPQRGHLVAVDPRVSGGAGSTPR